MDYILMVGGARLTGVRRSYGLLAQAMTGTS